MTPEAYAIRDALVCRVQHLGLFKSVKPSVVEQIEPAAELPAVTISLARETMEPDGDLNAGPPEFVNTLTAVAIIGINAPNKHDLEGNLALYGAAYLNVVLADPDFTRRIDGIGSVTQRNVFPSQGETYYAQARIEIAIIHRTTWWPEITEELKRLNITTRAQDADPQTPAIKARIDLPQT